MKWYWWVLIVIISLNLFVIGAVAIFVVYDHIRTRKALRQSGKGRGSDRTEERS